MDGWVDGWVSAILVLLAIMSSSRYDLLPLQSSTNVFSPSAATSRSMSLLLTFISALGPCFAFQVALNISLPQTISLCVCVCVCVCVSITDVHVHTYTNNNLRTQVPFALFALMLIRIELFRLVDAQVTHCKA